MPCFFVDVVAVADEIRGLLLNFLYVDRKFGFGCEVPNLGERIIDQLLGMSCLRSLPDF